jgi:hypothetical protein
MLTFLSAFSIQIIDKMNKIKGPVKKDILIFKKSTKNVSKVYVDA